jgi:purine nucleoside phosphorylase
MATTITRVCDLTGEPATLTGEASVGNTRFAIDLSEESAKTVKKALVEIGFRPTLAAVGHSLRGAYVAASGATFTTREARTWLAANGHDVPPTGKVSKSLLDIYAAAH